MRSLLVILPFVAAFGVAAPAMAQSGARACRIADPSPTPTNVRDQPAGAVVGTIANGTAVEVLAEGDGGGRPWALLVRPGSATATGWVARSLVTCG